MPGFLAMDLEKTVEKARKRLQKIQRSENKTKKRYLAVLSLLAMIIVVGLWFFYLQATLPHPAAIETEEVRDEDSFFRTIGRGAKNIIENLKNQFTELKANFSQVKEFSVEGGGAEFTPSP